MNFYQRVGYFLSLRPNLHIKPGISSSGVFVVILGDELLLINVTMNFYL